MSKVTTFVGILMSVLSAQCVELPLSDEAAERIARERLAKMTLEEKTSMCALCATMYLKAVPNAGINSEWAFSDCGHAMKPEHKRDQWGYIAGVDDRSTCMPCPSALAATWNPALAAIHGKVMGEQMRARGKNQMLGPGINIMRNPLCGRNWEYMSEDPYLASKMVVPLVKAAQREGVACTVKHFCLNSQELNRFDTESVVDDRALEEIYLPAFEAAIVEGGALSVMTAYNKLNGTFCSENSYLQKSVLRQRWGFKGMIVTDWGGQHSCENAVMNGGGIEANCGRGVKYLTDFWNEDSSKRYPLAMAVRAGKIPESAVDEMALHTLFTMAKTGFLTDELPSGRRLVKEHQEAARKVGEEAIVLAKNNRGVLPLKKEAVKKIVIFGRIADLEQAQLGSSCESHTLYDITFLKGLKEYLGDGCEIRCFPLGSEGDGSRPTPIDPLILDTFNPNASDAFVDRAWERRIFRGGKELSLKYVKTTTDKWDNNSNIKGSGEVEYEDVVEWHAKVVAPESGEYEFKVEQARYSSASIVVDGRTILDCQPGSLKVAEKLERGRKYDIVFRYYVGEDKNECDFGWTLPSARQNNPQQIAAAIEAADAVLVFTGTTMGHGQAKETEGGDRPNMLPMPLHNEHIAQILAMKNHRTVVICRTGSALEFPWIKDCDTMLITSYLGQECGRPMAKVLFGEVNPSGHLTYSWPKKYADTPTGFYGCEAYNPNRSVYLEGIYVGYRWYEKKEVAVDFPFGHGLSYTTFKYGDAEVEAIDAEHWRINVEVTNTGHREGAEVVQLYVRALDSVVDRPVKELKGFEKVFLAPGETKKVVFVIGKHDLAYWDNLASRFKSDAGRYEAQIGSSSADIRTKVIFKYGD